MISDKDIIVELLRQREELREKVDGKDGNQIQVLGACADQAKEIERLRKENTRIFSDLDAALEERDRLKKERDELRALFEELDADDLRKMLNIPVGERLLVQIVPKVKALMLELANAKEELKTARLDRELARANAIAYTKAGMPGQPTTLSALTIEASKPMHGYTMQQPPQNQ